MRRGRAVRSVRLSVCGSRHLAAGWRRSRCTGIEQRCRVDVLGIHELHHPLQRLGQPAAFLDIQPGQALHEPFLQRRRGLFQQRVPELRELDVDLALVAAAPTTGDEAPAFQPIDDAGDRRGAQRHAARELARVEGTTAADFAETDELRPGEPVMPGESASMAIHCSQDPAKGPEDFGTAAGRSRLDLRCISGSLFAHEKFGIKSFGLRSIIRNLAIACKPRWEQA